MKNIKPFSKLLNNLKAVPLAFVLLISINACGDKEYLNPSAASEQQVVSDVNGLITLCNGLQYRFTVGRSSPGYTMPTTAGLMTRELTVLNAGNTDEEFLRQGAANVQGPNAVLSQLWAQSNLVKANADLILRNADRATDLATRSGIVGYASIFRALALGNLATFWEKAPIAVGENAVFSTREEVLQEAVRQLETAAAGSVPSALFISRIVPGIDVPNTIQALIARYSLMLGDYDKAIAAADKVDLTKRSVFNFDDLSRNAMYDISFSNRNVTEPINTSFGLPEDLKPDAADKRIASFFNTTAGTNLGRASFYNANNTGIPVYRPGEVILIKAEAQARKNSVAAAITELNKILTKTTDVVGIGAGLSAYSGATTQASVLTEIYKQRCIELFLTGLKLDDSRRFGRPESERTRTFLPYPQNERDNNKSTPVDPVN
jgi:hypothetical protein